MIVANQPDGQFSNEFHQLLDVIEDKTEYRLASRPNSAYRYEFTIQQEDDSFGNPLPTFIHEVTNPRITALIDILHLLYTQLDRDFDLLVGKENNEPVHILLRPKPDIREKHPLVYGIQIEKTRTLKQYRITLRFTHSPFAKIDRRFLLYHYFRVVNLVAKLEIPVR